MPPVFSFALKIDTVDVDTFNFKVAEMRGWWDSPQVSYGEVQLADGFGYTATLTRGLFEPLDIVVSGNLIDTSPSSMETNLNSLKAALAGKLLTLVGGNDSNRQRTGYYTGKFNATPYPSMAEIAVDFTVRCLDPLQYATSDTTVSGSAASDISCPLGSYYSRPTITLTSPTSPTTLTYKNAGGTTIGTPLVLTFTGSPTTVVVGNSTVTADGARHDEYISNGDLILLNPRDGVYGSTYPTIRTSSGSISITYRKAYL